MHEVNRTVQKQLLSEVQKIIADQLPYIPILFFSAMDCYRIDKFAGWIMSNGTSADNWQTWLNIHLISSEEIPFRPTTYNYMTWSMMIVLVALVVVGFVKLRKTE